MTQLTQSTMCNGTYNSTYNVLPVQSVKNIGSC